MNQENAMHARYQSVAVDRQMWVRLKTLDPFAKLAPIVKRALAAEIAKLEREREDPCRSAAAE